MSATPPLIFLFRIFIGIQHTKRVYQFSSSYELLFADTPDCKEQKGRIKETLLLDLTR